MPTRKGAVDHTVDPWLLVACLTTAAAARGGANPNTAIDAWALYELLNMPAMRQAGAHEAQRLLHQRRKILVDEYETLNQIGANLLDDDAKRDLRLTTWLSQDQVTTMIAAKLKGSHYAWTDLYAARADTTPREGRRDRTRPHPDRRPTPRRIPHHPRDLPGTTTRPVIPRGRADHPGRAAETTPPDPQHPQPKPQPRPKPQPTPGATPHHPRDLEG